MSQSVIHQLVGQQCEPATHAQSIGHTLLYNKLSITLTLPPPSSVYHLHHACMAHYFPKEF